MKPVEATAPGKVILFGEHAVVYGRPAIAAPVAKVRATVTLQPVTTVHAGLRIVAADLGRDYRLDEAGPDDPLAAAVRIGLETLGQARPPDAVMNIRSTIPLGRGLGSGAAISTAIIRALGQLFERPLAPADISPLVYEVEKLYHGTPSGIDNTVIAFEQPVYFIRGAAIQRLEVKQPFTLIVGDTGQVSPTHAAVGDVRRRWQADQARYEVYFDQIGAIASQARTLIKAETADIAALGRLMDANQALLATIGVSSPELEELTVAARQAGALGAKLSGAGWGGNMIALAPSEQARYIASVLTGAGAAGVIVTEVN